MDEVCWVRLSKKRALSLSLSVLLLPPLTRDERIAPRTFAFDPFNAAEREMRERERERERDGGAEGALNYEPTTRRPHY